jgi:glyoxylase-like metal-dependent hydrolase (beta-lactamase superfamily II)
MTRPQAGAQHDITLILTPGHTRAHVCLYHAPTSTLFSGDHLSSPSDVDRPHDLEVFRDFNWWVPHHHLMRLISCQCRDHLLFRDLKWWVGGVWVGGWAPH